MTNSQEPVQLGTLYVGMAFTRPNGTRQYTVCDGFRVFGAEDNLVPYTPPEGRVLVRSDLGHFSLFHADLLVVVRLTPEQERTYKANCLAAEALLEVLPNLPSERLQRDVAEVIAGLLDNPIVSYPGPFKLPEATDLETYADVLNKRWTPTC